MTFVDMQQSITVEEDFDAEFEILGINMELFPITLKFTILTVVVPAVVVVSCKTIRSFPEPKFGTNDD